MAHILIVEDNESLCLAYSSFLSQEGHRVVAINNVKDALIYLTTVTPDIILLDMLLPKMNGLELLKAYDVVSAHPTVKVVALSNYSEGQIRSAAEKLGVKTYLTKSLIDPKELASIVNEVTAAS
jgi:CheY-like chemotaxis protein